MQELKMQNRKGEGFWYGVIIGALSLPLVWMILKFVPIPILVGVIGITLWITFASHRLDKDDYGDVDN
jgi:hypothetical protein